MDQAVQNTDVEIWHSPDDMKSRSIRMSKQGEALTICVSGLCVTMPLTDWHELAADHVEQRYQANATPSTHDFVPNRQHPTFCDVCGYGPSEPLKHTQQ